MIKIVSEQSIKFETNNGDWVGTLYFKSFEINEYADKPFYRIIPLIELGCNEQMSRDELEEIATAYFLLKGY